MSDTEVGIGIDLNTIFVQINLRFTFMTERPHNLTVCSSAQVTGHSVSSSWCVEKLIVLFHLLGVEFALRYQHMR